MPARFIEHTEYACRLFQRLQGPNVGSQSGEAVADRLSTTERSLRMASVRQRDTSPERIIRSLLHRAGFRFRTSVRRLAGSPDIVLPRWRTVIFVHGCFWHGHDCHLYKLPATRTDFWRSKVVANITRDRNAIDALHKAGWKTIVVWQCSITGKSRLKSDALSRVLVAAVNGNTPMIEVRGQPLSS